MSDLVALIQNTGFPIACTIFLFLQNQKITDSVAKLNNTLTSIDRRLEILEKEVEKHEQYK